MGPSSAGPSRRERRLWWLGYGLATFLSFPHPNPLPLGPEVIDLGRWIAFAGPACLALALRGRAVGAALWQTFLGTWITHAAIMHWVFIVVTKHGGAPAFLGLLSPFFPAGYMALCLAPMGAAFVLLTRSPVRLGGAFALALLYVASDHLRAFLFTGLPWATLGYTQHANPLLLPMATQTGVYGLAFTTALMGGALAGLRDGVARWPVGDRLALVVAMLLHLVYGAGGSGDLKAPAGPTVRIAAVQGNIAQQEKWDRTRLEGLVARHIRLSHLAADQGARIIVWPETAVPGLLRFDRPSVEAIAELAAQREVALVVGSVGAELDEEGERIERFYDSAFVFDADGRPLARYDKTHLVPFGEYVPLRWLLGGVIGAVARGAARTDVSAGERPEALALPWPSDAVGGSPDDPLMIGIPICYELLFPDLVRRFVSDGAGVLLAITNDAWYGDTGAPLQFLAMTALRSAETGVWTVRAANTGVSAIIDSGGRVISRSGLFVEDVVVADVPIRTRGEQTFYVRNGNIFAYLCWVVLAFWLGFAVLRTARQGAFEPVGGGDATGGAGEPRPAGERE